jgi:hypothetical protein
MIMSPAASSSFVTVALFLGIGSRASCEEIRVDSSGYSPKCGVDVQAEGGRLRMAWPMGKRNPAA